MGKTIAPFQAPKFFQEHTRQRNGGLKGLRCMRRAYAELHQIPADRRPADKTVRGKRGRFVNQRTAWLQERAIELYLASSFYRSDLYMAAA